jgi:hypothetical protein
LSQNYQFKLLTIAGIINSEDMNRFTKIIFRTTRGNSLLYTFDIPSSQSSNLKSKSLFIIMVEGGGSILAKLNRICDSFAAKKYTLPDQKN